MSADFYIDPGVVLRAAGVARDHSGTVTGYLQSVDRDVQDLMVTWKGAAATAYSEAWEDLLALLHSMAAELDRLGEHVGDSARSFVQADQCP